MRRDTAGADRPRRPDGAEDEDRGEHPGRAREHHRSAEVEARIRLELARTPHRRERGEQEGEQDAQDRRRQRDHRGSGRAQRHELCACHAQRAKGRIRRGLEQGLPEERLADKQDRGGCAERGEQQQRLSLEIDRALDLRQTRARLEQ
jgi:hypothetical protein